MSPEKVSGVVQYLKARGPFMETKLEDKPDSAFALLPKCVALGGGGGLLSALSIQAESNSKYLGGYATPDGIDPTALSDGPVAHPGLTASTLKRELVPMSSDVNNTTAKSSYGWIFTQNPQYATAFSMVESLREVQQTVAQSLFAWCTDENALSSFLVPGLVGDVDRMDKALSRSEQFKEQCESVIMKLLEKSQAKEDESILAELLPRVQSFQSILDQAGKVRNMLKVAMQKKAEVFLRGESKILTDMFDVVDFVKWMGLTVRANRSMRKIKQQLVDPQDPMLAEKIENQQKAFLSKVAEVSTTKDVLNVKECLEAAWLVDWKTSLYLLGAAAMFNLFIKPAKRVPAEHIKSALRTNINGFVAKGYWQIPSEGKPPAISADSMALTWTLVDLDLSLR